MCIRDSVRVSDFDDPPTFATTPVTSATEDSPYQLNLQANDEEGGPLQYVLSAAPESMKVDSTGSLTWLPSAADVGSHIIGVTITDPSGQSASLSFTIEVQAVNDAPQIITQIPESPHLRNV